MEGDPRRARPSEGSPAKDAGRQHGAAVRPGAHVRGRPLGRACGAHLHSAAPGEGGRPPRVKEAIDALRTAHRIALVSYRDPEGDTVGSALALGLALEAAGEDVSF